MFLHDGHTREITDSDLVRGHVIRDVRIDANNEQASYAFSDCVIVDVLVDRENHKYVKLARPYCYATSTECCPVVLTGIEQFEVSAAGLCSPERCYRLVVMSTGEPAKFVTR